MHSCRHDASTDIVRPVVNSDHGGDIMEKKFDVICMGGICQDIIISGIPPQALTEGRTAYKADEMFLTLGGDAANETAIFTKLGDHAALLARIGTDQRGQMLKRELEDRGADTSLLVAREDCMNLGSLVVCKTDGTHVYLVQIGQNFQLDISDIDLSLFAQTRAICIASLYDLGELEVNGLDKVFEAGKAGGALIFTDTNIDLENRGRHIFDPLFPLIDYMVPSLEEAVYITGGKTDPEEIADYFLELGVKNVLVKMGGDGSYFKNAQESFYMPAYDVTPFNTSGCGDNFTSGFAHAILKGTKPEDAVRFATGIGGLNTTGLGSNHVVQSEEHVLEFMRTHRLKSRK